MERSLTPFDDRGDSQVSILAMLASQLFRTCLWLSGFPRFRDRNAIFALWYSWLSTIQAWTASYPTLGSWLPGCLDLGGTPRRERPFPSYSFGRYGPIVGNCLGNTTLLFLDPLNYRGKEKDPQV